MTEQELGLFMGTMAVTMVIMSLILYVVVAIGMMKVFEKAGKPAWAAWVPVYNYWIWFEVAGMPGALSLIVIGVIIPILNFLILPAFGIIYIISHFKMATAFGQGPGFAVGLWFLNPIFIMILGFGKSTYQLGQSNNNQNGQVQGTKFCSNCGTQGTSRFCANCGAETGN